MNSETIAQQILKYVFSPEYRPSKPKAIHKALKLVPLIAIDLAPEA
jgi:hypothetical protein